MKDIKCMVIISTGKTLFKARIVKTKVRFGPESDVKKTSRFLSRFISTNREPYDQLFSMLFNRQSFLIKILIFIFNLGHERASENLLKLSVDFFSFFFYNSSHAWVSKLGYE